MEGFLIHRADCSKVRTQYNEWKILYSLFEHNGFYSGLVVGKSSIGAVHKVRHARGRGSEKVWQFVTEGGG